MVQLVGSNSLGLSKVINGKTQYVHIKYSAYEDGMIMTDAIVEDTKFIGVLVTFSPQPSPMPGDYSWARFVASDGKDGIAGKDGKGISSTTITYGLSTTDTVEPTNYTSNVPRLVKGQYLWTKTVWKYTDTTTETGYTKTYIAKDGNDGTNGLAGKDGVGISNTAITYVSSTNGTTAPATGWGSTIPTVPEGSYLWTRTIWTYTDNTTETGYSVARMGANGAKGATGTPGVSSYTWIRYSPNANGSSMTTSPAANSLYIGVAITSSNSAPTDYTAYTWALIKGADGKGIKSAVVDYQASTSGTVIPTGSWVTTVPSVPKGQYLWTRVITTYTDNTVSPPSYSTSYQGVDGITNVTGLLTNESITLPANVGGTVTTYTGATGTFDVYEGLTKKTGSGVTYSVVDQSQSNIVVSINATTGVYTITSMTSGLTALSGYATLRAIYNGVTIDKQINVAKAVTGATGSTGATGAPATSYWITASNNIIGKSQTGVINPTTITFKGFSKTGTANSVAYSGRFIIQTSTNGTAYTTRYTSSADQNSYTYTIPADSLFVKCLFYMADGTTVLLDEQTVPIVESAEGIQVGQRNLIPYSTIGEYAGGSLRDIGNRVSVVGSKVTIKQKLTDLVGFEVKDISSYRGQDLILTFKTDDLAPMVYHKFNTTSQVGTKMLKEKEDIWKLILKVPIDASSLIIGVGRFPHPTTFVEYWVDEVQLRYGNKYVDWQPAPEDARTYKAWANSSDGTIDFTRVYPNENLLLESNQSVTTSSYGVRDYPLADDTLTATDDVVITLKGSLGADRTRFQVYNSGGTNTIGQLTPLGNGIYQYKGKWNPTGGNSFLTVYQIASTGTSSSTIEWIKLERGTTPTVYTTNTADSLTGSVPKYVGFSPLDSDKPSDYEWIINPEWTESSSMEYTSSSIEKTSESIMTTVTESFVADEDYTKYREDIATQFTQTAKDFNLLFSTVSEEVKKVESGSETKFEKIEKYIRFVDGKIILGTSDSDSVLELSNDRISFIQGGNEVAHFAGQTFTISKGILTDSMQVGDHRMTKNAGGLTTFDYLP